ncbi:MAG: UDP-3-O-(3-hydroxymyristoyl)glucosamine N-acyltransferase [Alphaproteobacteria bacterium]
MADPRFYVRAGPFTLEALADLTSSMLGPRASAGALVRDVASLETAEAGDIAFSQSARIAEQGRGRPGIALIIPPDIAQSDLSVALLLNRNPARAFAEIAAAFYPAAEQPQFKPGTMIDESAKLAVGAQLGAGAVVGAGAEIGQGTVVAPNAVIGPGVLIGRNCRIGANVSITHTLIGDRVIVHPGTSLGQDGFGFIGSSRGHIKVPQLGRVIIQDDVEIGACVTVDRGALGDTVIGEGTKIDNLVHIGHNCRIGRHALIAGQVGLSGSVTIGDFVMLGGQAGVADHRKIGDFARVAAKGGVMTDVPERETFAGFPARPRFKWLREVAWVEKSVTKEKGAAKGKGKVPDSEET